MSEIEKKDVGGSILTATTLNRSLIRNNNNNNVNEDMTRTTIEGSFTSSNSDEYMDEEDGVDMDSEEEDSSDSESDDDEEEDSEADDEEEDESMDVDTNQPSTSHNTRSSSKGSPSKASPKKSPVKAKSDTNKSTNGTKKEKKKKTDKNQKTSESSADSLPMGAECSTMSGAVVDDEDAEEEDGKPEAYIPTHGDGLGPDDLEYDESAYIMYHKAECGYPCLSFDIIPDGLGTGETRSSSYPQSIYLVAGTQAPKVHANKLLVMKMSNLNKIKEKKKEEDSEDDDDDEEDMDKDADPSNEPELLAAQVPHDGGVNRVRCVKLGTYQ